MEAPVVLVVVATVILVLLRHFAARRVAAGQGQLVWVIFAPAFLGAVVVIWVAVQILTRSPLFGVVIGLAGIMYLGLLVRLMARLSKAVSSAPPQGDLSAAVTDPIADYMLTVMGVTLLGGVIALIGLVVWGVSQTGR